MPASGSLRGWPQEDARSFAVPIKCPRPLENTAKVKCARISPPSKLLLANTSSVMYY